MNLSYSIDNSIPKQGFGNEEPTSGLGTRSRHRVWERGADIGFGNEKLYGLWNERVITPPPQKKQKMYLFPNHQKCICSQTPVWEHIA